MIFIFFKPNSSIIRLSLCIAFGCLFTISCKKSPTESDANKSVVFLDNYLFPTQHTFSESTLATMLAAHPQVTRDFFYFILNIDTTKLSSSDNIQRIAYFGVQHKIIHDTLTALGINIDFQKKELDNISERFREVFKLPDSFQFPPLYAYTAPIDAPAVALFPTWIGINLTLFGGKNFPLYSMFEFQSIFPKYLHHRLQKEYIPLLVVQQILADRFPLEEKQHSLMEKMINQGKYLYVMKKLISKKEPNIFLFTEEQLEWCEKNEREIWSHIRTLVKDVYTTSPETIRNYIGEAPYTTGMPDDSPGNIGSWVGFNIVNAFMDTHNLSLLELMNANPYQIFQQSAYHP